MTGPNKIAQDGLNYTFWKTVDGYVLRVFVSQGVAGDRHVSITVPTSEAEELSARPELLKLKALAVAHHPDMFRDEMIDFISPE